MTIPKISDEGATSPAAENGAPRQAASTDAGERAPLRERAKRAAISVFLAFHLFSIACWCLPIDSPLIPLYRNLIRPYFLWAGLFQSWDMFAPIPKAANTYIEATLVYRDGSRKIWTFPRLEEMSLTEKLFQERYRKFAENLQQDELDGLLPDAARYIARGNGSAGNPVQAVILTQKFSFIVPRADGTYVPEPWQAHILLAYGVRPEDLE